MLSDSVVSNNYLGSCSIAVQSLVLQIRVMVWYFKICHHPIPDPKLKCSAPL